MRFFISVALPLVAFMGLAGCGADASNPLANDDDGGATASSSSSSSSSSGSTPPADGGTNSASAKPPSAIIGMWVWMEEREKAVDGTYTVTRTITEPDLVWKVGPTGWPGCPAGISCLRYGNNVLLANDAGRYHQMRRVTTGSDYQNFGSYTDDGAGLLTLQREQEYSCAHPLVDTTKYPKPAALFARYRKVGSDLWVTPFADKDPGAEPKNFTVYRAITSADFTRYDLKFCGIGREGATKCHCLCPSKTQLTGYGCTT